MSPTPQSSARFGSSHSRGYTLANERRFRLGHGADDGEHRAAQSQLAGTGSIMTRDPPSTRMNRNRPRGRDEACAVSATRMPELAPNGQIPAAMMVRRPDCHGPCLPPAVRNAPIVHRKKIRRYRRRHVCIARSVLLAPRQYGFPSANASKSRYFPNNRTQWSVDGIPRPWENPKRPLANLFRRDSTPCMIRAGFLDSESRRDLIDLGRDGSVDHRLGRRANALVLLDDGMSCGEVARVLLLDDDTVRTWYRLYQEEGIEGLAGFGHGGGTCPA
jgi:hypothetical protein